MGNMLPTQRIMLVLDHLPEPPHFDIEVLEDEVALSDGFLRLRRRRLCTRDQGGDRGPPFLYDEIAREALDAVVVVAHFQGGPSDAREPYVVLRSAVRPPVVLRDARVSPLLEPMNRALWELPAGLVEEDERNAEGIKRCAVRELAEEIGVEVSVDALEPLGASAFPAPGMIAERQFFFHVGIAPLEAKAPTLDGSPLEEVGSVVAVPLRVALEAAQNGHLADAKTELSLLRFHWSLENESAES